MSPPSDVDGTKRQSARTAPVSFGGNSDCT
jgi:hypothetical protein